MKSIQGWVANTHWDWFNFLRTRRTAWDEVNFWTPSDYYAFHGVPGSPFFFRLMSPRNVIGGFGYVASFSRLPEYMAWEWFGEGNGAESFARMKSRLDGIRVQNALQGRTGQKQIGCIILADVVFFSEDLWIPQPTDWGRQNLRHKRYDLREGEGYRLWNECQARVAFMRGPATTVSMIRESTPRYGDPVLVRPRLGQGAFRVVVTDAYARACAVTGEHSLPALEAAHIKPFAAEGPHEINNGVLLRSDLHKLFDAGYVTVTSERRLEVSRRLRDDFQNGKSYYPLHGQAVSLPPAEQDHPRLEYLQWHNETVYKG